MKSENKTAVAQLEELKAKADALPEQLEHAMITNDIHKFRELAALQYQLKSDIQAVTIMANQEKIAALKKKSDEIAAQQKAAREELAELEKAFNAARDAFNQKSHEVQNLSMIPLTLSSSIGALNAENDAIQQKMKAELTAQFKL